MPLPDRDFDVTEVAVALLHPARFWALGRPAEYLERTAYLATGWRLGRYYRTYPAYVEDEVRAALDEPAIQFRRGPITLIRAEPRPTTPPPSPCGTATTVGARPGDAYLFGRRFLDLLEEHQAAS